MQLDADPRPETTATASVAPVTRNRLVAVVVTHNRLAQLKTTVRALLASAQNDLAAVLVVDNASDDGTAGWLAAQSDKRLCVLTSRANLGGAGGFETGLRHAVHTLRPDWVVVMDDDARPEQGALAAFHTLDLRGWDGLAAAVRHPDGTICEMNRPTLNPFWHKRLLLRTALGGGRGAFHLGPQDFARTGTRPIDGASFVGLFLSAKIFDAAGYPDGKLFLYGDDAIYTLGLTRAGYRLGFDPSVRFEHDSTTYSTQDRRIKPLWKVYYYHRNLLILYRLATGAFFLPVLMVVLPRWLGRVRHHSGERRAFLRLFGMAIRDGLARRTDVAHSEVLKRAER
ncbi:MAG: putative glycosyltransferase [Rhodobacteraceae bacterium HLUCCA12]|nr:MAG: putative glycosyltransferase [Rhodobacteraceae bacterium HLUCCA12]